MAEKRDRGKNFAEVEKDQLVEICLKYKSVIENKKTDKYSTRDKNKAWESVREEYNSIQFTGLREVKTLKSLYDGLKMKARKEKTEERVAIYKTGGGAPSSSMTPLSNKIVGQLESHFEPLPNPYDSSSSFFDEQMMVIPVTQEVEKVVEVEEVEEVENNEMPTPTRPTEKGRREIPIKNIEEKTRKRKFESKALLREEYHAKEHAKKMMILAKEEQAADLKIQHRKIKIENAKKNN